MKKLPFFLKLLTSIIFSLKFNVFLVFFFALTNLRKYEIPKLDQICNFREKN